MRRMPLWLASFIVDYRFNAPRNKAEVLHQLKVWKDKSVIARRTGNTGRLCDLNAAKARLMQRLRNFNNHCSDCGVAISHSSERCAIHFRNRGKRKLLTERT